MTLSTNKTPAVGRTTAPHRVPRSDLPALVARAHRLLGRGSRQILGITGAPAAGKSTLADEIVDALRPHAVLVPMDGFHLAEAELERLGTHDRKGAIDTFDIGGFLSLLRRLRAAEEPVVYAPVFRRDLEEAIAGAIRVPISAELVVTEGNYLLTDTGDWSGVRDLLDEVWYLELDERIRLDRLIRRHMGFGRDRRAAEERARGSDQRNADLIEATKGRADLLVVDH